MTNSNLKNNLLNRVSDCHMNTKQLHISAHNCSLKTEKMELTQKDRLTNKFLTVEDVASLFQLPKSWVYEKTRIGEIPHTKLGKYLRFDYLEILGWFNKNSSTLKSSNKRRL